MIEIRTPGTETQRPVELANPVSESHQAGLTPSQAGNSVNGPVAHGRLPATVPCLSNQGVPSNLPLPHPRQETDPVPQGGERREPVLRELMRKVNSVPEARTQGNRLRG